MKRHLRVLVFLLCSLTEAYQRCNLQAWDIPSFSQTRDFILGGLIVVHSGYDPPDLTFRAMPKPPSCKGFHRLYYRDVLGVIFAIDEINTSMDLLPNITLGFSFLDSCMSELRAIWGALSLVSGTAVPVPQYDCRTSSKLIGIIGETMSALSVPVARILGVLHFPQRGLLGAGYKSQLIFSQLNKGQEAVYWYKVTSTPQISHGASTSALSDKMNFPSFLRTMSTNVFQNIVISHIISTFGWTWVGILVVDNDVGEQGGQIIRKEIEKRGSCVAFIEKIHFNYSKNKIQRVVHVIKQSSANVIVLHSPEAHVNGLLDALYDGEVIGKIFISSASFTMTPGFFSKKAWKVLNGTIGLIASTGPIPGFEEFLHNLHPTNNSIYPFIQMFWEVSFNCTWLEKQNNLIPHGSKQANLCTGKEDVKDLILNLLEINDLSYPYHSYMAAYAYAHALHALLGCRSQNGSWRCSSERRIQPWQVLQYLKKTPFRAKTGDWITFDSNGDLSASYDIMTIQVLSENFQLVKVGTFNPRESQGNTITINTSSILWNEKYSDVPRSSCTDSCLPGHRRVARQGQPVCCYDCVPCSAGEMSNSTDAVRCLRCPSDQWSGEERDRCVPKSVEFLSYQEPLGLVLLLTVTIFAIITCSILSIFVKYKETAIIKATNTELSYILLVSLIFCFLCCLVFIGQPSMFTCRLRQTFFSIVFSISISSVLAKTVMVILAFKATSPNSSLKRWLGPKIPRSVVGLCSIVQTTICSAWILSDPPFPRMNTESEDNKIIYECHEGQNLFFYGSLGFLGFLAVVSFLVAFLARNLPDSFNEAKLITFSMLVFCSVWISFIPAYLSTRGKYTVAVQIFAILTSCAGLLGCIFVPKCYIILLRPERNSREYLTSSKGFGIRSGK